MDNVAIVLFMGQTGLGVTRSLGMSGISVYGIDWNRKAIGFSSKYCKKKLIFPNPMEDPGKFIELLIELSSHIDHKGVLLPTTDYYVDLLSQFRPALSDYFYFNIPKPSIIDILTDKKKQYKIAEKLKIPIPKTLSPTSINEMMAHKDSLYYPLVIKGTKSDLWVSEFGKKAFIANDFDELNKIINLTSKKHIPVVVQEMILGPNRNHYKVCAYYSKNGKLLGIFTTQKKRQFPIDFGIGSYMHSMHNYELVNLGKKFFNGVGYTGVGSIEFKKDERDGKFKLIELNPRFWQQNIQATHAGMNFALLYFLDCIGEQAEPCLDFNDDVRWLDLTQDFRSFLKNKNIGEVSLVDWLGSIIKADCFAYFDRNDIKPILSQFLLNIQKGRKKITKYFIQ